MPTIRMTKRSLFKYLSLTVLSGAVGRVKANNYEGSEMSGAISSVISILKSFIGYTRHFATVADAKADRFLRVGQRISIDERESALFDVVLTSNTVPNTFNIIQCVSSPKLSLVLKVNASMHVKAFGVTTLNADNSGAILAALKSDAQELTGNKNETYIYTNDIVSIGKSINLTDLHMIGIDAEMILRGAITELGALTSGGIKGGKSLSCGTVAGVEVGDLLVIDNQVPSSFSQHRVGYTDGEMNKVAELNDNNLIMQHAFRGVSNYPILPTTKIFKITPIKLTLKNSSFKSSGMGAAFALSINFAESISLYGVNVRGTKNLVGGLLLDKCFDVRIKGGNFIHKAVNTGNYHYGISLSSCQLVTINNALAYGTRHGITTGSDISNGSVPCRDVRINNTYISNSPESNIYAADFHGNTSDSGYYNCRIDNDIGIGGENITVRGCNIQANRTNPGIELQEIVGGVINIDGNTTTLGPNFNFDVIIAFSASSLAANVDRGFELNILDLSCELNSGVTKIVTMLFNQKNAVKSTLDIRNFNVSGNASGLTHIATLVTSGSGLAPDQVSINAGKFHYPALTEFVSLSGNFTGTTMSLPSQTMPITELTIPEGGHSSSKGGTGDSGLFVWNHTKYPAQPYLSVNVQAWSKAGDPRFFGFVDSANSSQATLFLGTAAASITSIAERKINMNATTSFDSVVL